MFIGIEFFYKHLFHLNIENILITFRQMSYDAAIKVNFSSCIDPKYKSSQKPTNLTNTIEYYVNEMTLKEDWMDNFSKVIAFTLDNALTSQECEKLIAIAEKHGFKDIYGYRKEYRGNKRVTLECDEVAKILYNRIKHLIPQELTINGVLHKPTGLNPSFRFGKYDQNDAFAAHKDSGFSSTGRTALTIMYYLNSTSENAGGHTRMLTLNKTGKKSEDVNCKVLDSITPTQGKCIIFNQSSIYHDGEPVLIPPKYIMRTDIIYKN